jgi:hypothetical protein
MLDKVSQLRNDYYSCIKLAAQTDSKKEDAYLKSEAAKSLAELVKLCSHQYIVCLQSEYSGSSSMDYDDHTPEHRICLCCGIEEYGYKKPYGKDFQRLTVKPFARFEGKAPQQVRHPLSYLLTEAVEIAEKEGWHYFG